MKCRRGPRRRAGISELVGTVLTTAITIMAGFAVFGFVNGQAGVSELAYGTNVGNTNNFLAENFKVIDAYFSTTTASGGSCSGSLYCTLAFWAYNTGSTNLQTFSVRLYDSAGQINVLYNYTGTSKTDRVYDLKATSAYYYSTCRMPGATYESPTISTVSAKIQNAQLFLLTIPPTTTNCPSYGKTFTTGTTYYAVVTGLYGNVVTYYQVK